MSFEDILKGYVGKNVKVRVPGEDKELSGELTESEGKYYVHGNGNPLPIDEIDSARAGKELDIELSDSDYFEGGLIN